MLNNKILAILSVLVLSLVSSHTTLADSSYRVKSSDNLSKIAAREYAGSGLTKSQILVGIYASNPKSFKDGNINKINKGQRLILPSAAKIDQISPQEADLVLSSRKTLQKKKTKKRSTKRKVKAKSKRTKKVVRKKKTVSNNNLAKQNIQKINRLEKESDGLKKRLDALLAEKKESDKKLKELEVSLRSALTKTAVTSATTSAVTTAVSADSKESQMDSLPVTNQENQQPAHKNGNLEQQPENTKGETSTNAQAQTNKLAVQNINSTSAVSSNSTENENSDESVIQNTIESSVESPKVKKTEEASMKQTLQAGMSSFDISNKYVQWGLLGLILFPILWLTWRFLLKSRQEPEWVAPVNESGFLEREDGLADDIYQNAPTDSGIKLDVASAYIDSGEINEAIQLLNEVMQEGSDVQRAQAQTLLERI